jgi:Uma2 family endonuclease
MAAILERPPQIGTTPTDKIKRWTSREFARLPEYGNSSGPHIGYELLEGELLMSPAPQIDHQRIILNLGSRQRNHVVSHGLGEIFIAPVDVILDDGNTVEPDIVFVEKSRESIVTRENIAGAPTLCIEIVSPFSSRRDRVTKFGTYARFAIPFYWIVDPAYGTVEEFALENQTYSLVREWSREHTFTPRLFDGLAIAVAEIFA